MMRPGPREGSSRGEADIVVCLFPHLPDFLVLDARKGLPSGPHLSHLSTHDVLGEPFFQQVEAAFHNLLQPRGRSLMFLTLLPDQVEALVRQEGMKAIIAALDTSVAAPRRVALLICAGDPLRLPEDEVRHLFSQAARGQADAATLADWVRRFDQLRRQEMAAVEREELERAQEAVNPSGGEFYTLWENPNR